MPQTLFSLAFHAYALGAMAYLTALARPWRAVVWAARILTGVGWVLHGLGLLVLFHDQGGPPNGLGQGISLLAFLLVAVFLAVDLRYRAPVMGAFLSPAAVAVWIPGLWLLPNGGEPAAAAGQRLLPVHIAVALIGLAVFAVATGVAAVYLLMDREVKGKHFGLLFTRLPSLEFLDALNRRLVVFGFIALSLTLLTGAWVAAHTGPFLAWQSKEIATAVAWAMFALLLQARLFAGWRGRRVALLTMAGFAVLLVSFFTTYGANGHGGAP